MTTIVYRDGILAADRRVSKNDFNVGSRCKISEVHARGSGGLLGWVACTGWPADLTPAATWLSMWPDVDIAPKRFQDGDAVGMFLLVSGEVWILAGDAPFQIKAEFHATGSGFEIAMGALAMGAGAVKAVEIASAYDQATGGGVDSVGDFRAP